MKHGPQVIITVLLLLVTHQSVADECWAVSNIKGYSAFASDGYKFSQDGLRGTITVCFGAKNGTVTGTDVQFVKFGASTLAGYSGSDRGNELFEVYQLDREKRKLLYVKTRIGVKNLVPVLSDGALSFVGDVTPISR